MTSADDALIVYAAIAVMAAAALATRLLGPEIMRRLGRSPRAERFLEALSSAVIAGIVATAVARGGWREAAAIAAAAVVMVVGRSALGAMLSGVAVAALWTALLGATGG